MSKAPVGLFYGSSTCYTEIVADKIREILSEEVVDVYNITDDPLVIAEQYDYLIMGIPTWDYGELQEDWEEIWEELDQVNFAGRKVALYGLGDQVGYPEWFLDAMGYLHFKLVKLGAQMVGYWPNDGYDFEGSKALTEDQAQFVGLAIDDENQFDLTDERLAKWCDQIMREFKLIH
ncbi:flavodoxin FldB [Aestuariicella hydrocarbonica]|uniref:Flavodoxin n=1 Tax=Pseudomaricurvus hydrocarbonicus TaxID=1470433 RepID=A0A9E5JQH3_9GAMM|nr:flavodoxin FldB [Aestuariicella hydrocarbonica]NHO64803.1 flavodoxin FldB [Aestuariicella hydrocarbonica]